MPFVRHRVTIEGSVGAFWDHLLRKVENAVFTDLVNASTHISLLERLAALRSE